MNRTIQKKNHETAVQIPPQFLIALRTWTPPGTSTLCDWRPRAEPLDRSLDAYTPVPSTPSSMGALVQSETTVANRPKSPRMRAYFPERFQAQMLSVLIRATVAARQCVVSHAVP